PTTKHGIQNINLSLKHGHKLAFIGESGNGKSTLLNIINGLIPPDGGKITFSYKNNHYHPSECCIGAVSQDGHIFDETVLYNITLREDFEYPNSRLEDLLRICCLTEVINELPDRLNTKLGKNGVTLSKGQFQRILIARALYKDSGILIFDEPTSALDIKTSNEVIDNILTAYPNKTIIVATHKLFVANKMDYVVLLKKGQIIKEFDLTQPGENNGVTINDLM
ncbi:MAG TPA: ATP-binding cassette domain-containing protein, partial [Saprospiraceae bacterium]|nr:ATP-binding cassette domain-containing protein [Saprospiraceae bacterium]